MVLYLILLRRLLRLRTALRTQPLLILPVQAINQILLLKTVLAIPRIPLNLIQPPMAPRATALLAQTRLKMLQLLTPLPRTPHLSQIVLHLQMQLHQSPMLRIALDFRGRYQLR